MGRDSCGITGGLVYSIIVLPIEFSVGYSSAKQIAPFIGIAFGYLSGLIVSNVWLDVEMFGTRVLL